MLIPTSPTPANNVIIMMMMMMKRSKRKEKVGDMLT